ncbi:CidA/LrgA family protein [Thalassotalea aquiviva]|uniref:CidA/LrgA family protein n=1 Tax=Thalassotalea aquiviva TaxID=3242415 RepID=UPI00352B0D00
MLNFIIGLAVLLIFQLLGEVAVAYFELPVTGPVAGMLLLFACLVIRGKVGKKLGSASTHLLSHLSLLFVPAGVGLMMYFQILQQHWLAIVVALVLSTIIMLVANALIMQWTTQWFKGKEE